MSVSPLVELVKVWLHGFETGDLDLLEHSFHNDFCQITHPQTVGRGTRNKDEYAEYLRQTIPQWTECKLSILSIMESPGKVICHFVNETKTTDGPNPPYEAIIIVTVVIDNNGALKIKKIEEFVDSKTRIEQMKGFAANSTRAKL